MICENCKIQLDPSDRFCRNCGAKVEKYFPENTLEASSATVPQEGTSMPPADQPADLPVSSQPEGMPLPDQPAGGKRNSYLWLLWLIPVVTAIIAGAFVYAYYLYEKDLNLKVETMKQQAENAALEGNFEEASKILTKALKYRPNHPALKTDMEILKKGENISGILKNVDQLIKDKKYDDALSSLSKADETIKQNNGVFSAIFSKIIDNKRTLIKVMQLKNDAGTKESIFQLCPIYKTVSGIDIPEAKKTAEDILKRIEDLASNDVKKNLKNKSYGSIADELDFALRYIKDNKKLLSLKEDIQKKMDEYEGELRRITMEVIGKESAVKNGSLSVSLDESEDKYMGPISGVVLNNGTEKYYNVRVQFKVYDELGNIMDEITVPCYPETVGPGSSAEFYYDYAAPYPKIVRPVGITFNTSDVENKGLDENDKPVGF